MKKKVYSSPEIKEVVILSENSLLENSPIPIDGEGNVDTSDKSKKKEFPWQDDWSDENR